MAKKMKQQKHEMPDEIFAWPFNSSWEGGYYRTKPLAPMDDKGLNVEKDGVVYIRKDLVEPGENT